jgi:hypothetical protein
MAEPASAQDLFKGRHFDHEIIILYVRWYLTFKHRVPNKTSETPCRDGMFIDGETDSG